MTIQKGELWIGMVELSGSRENPILAGCEGAYSTYLVRCEDELGFRRAADRSAADLELVVVDLQWAELYVLRAELHELEEYLYEMARLVKGDGEGRFGRFHVWEDDS